MPRSTIYAACLALAAFVSGAGAQSVSVYQTTPDLLEALSQRQTLHFSSKAAPAATLPTITVDDAQRFQEIDGFGASLTDAAAWLFAKKLTPAQTDAAFKSLFSRKDGIALSFLRQPIGSSDLAVTFYSYDDLCQQTDKACTTPADVADLNLDHYSLAHDQEYILPLLKKVLALNPAIHIMLTPWSPPGWMKSNGSMLGGAMRKHSFEPYARYFVKFLEAYKAEGVHVNAVTVQNETDTDQDGRMPACLWGQEYEIDFVQNFLGPALRKAGSPTKIWVLDHNYNLWGRAIGELSVPEAAQYIDGIAWHGYMGEPSAMSRVHEAFPQKNAYWTEGGPDIAAADYQTDFTRWAETYNGILRNWARSITAWNLALDEKGNPNIGPFSCGGVLTVENGTHKVTRSGQYWAFAHFSKHVRRGARVFRTDGVGEGEGSGNAVTHAGFRNPDGSLVVVLTNSGEEKRVQLLLGSKALELDLPAGSVYTLQWS